MEEKKAATEVLLDEMGVQKAGAGEYNNCGVILVLYIGANRSNVLRARACLGQTARNYMSWDTAIDSY